MNNATTVDFRKYLKPARSAKPISIKRQVFLAIPDLEKKFDEDQRKPLYVRTRLLSSVDGDRVFKEEKYLTLQDVIDNCFIEFPQLRQYATKRAIEESMPKPEPEAQGEFTDKYWECGCEEDYLHTIEEDTCSVCSMSYKDGSEARVKDVLAAGLPL